MIIDLPSELLHAIVETLHTRSTLTSLCRVSKAFNRAFTPFLYQQIVLDGYNLQWLKLIAGFQLGSHLQFTKELEIVVESTWTPGMKDVADNLSICLVKMTRLMTLTYVYSLSLEIQAELRLAFRTLSEKTTFVPRVAFRCWKQLPSMAHCWTSHLVGRTSSYCWRRCRYLPI